MTIRAIVTLLFVMMGSMSLSAKGAGVRGELQTKTEVAPEGDTTQQAILGEIQRIRELQEASKEERERIRRERRKHDQNADGASAELSNEYGAMLQIADNTHPDGLRDGWNLFGWVSIIVAFISLIVAVITYIAQHKTEQHTTNAPIDVQLWKLRDLPRHFYRDLVCTCAIILRHKAEGRERERRRYPSESNLLKLQTMPDDIVLPIDVDRSRSGKDNALSRMHELRLLLRNYNVEVEVCSEHLSRKLITDASLVLDFDNLLFKPLFLTASTFGFERALPVATDEDLALRAVRTILAEHFRKLRESSNFALLTNASAQEALTTLLSASDIIGRFRTSIDSKGGIQRSAGFMLKAGKSQADLMLDRASTLQTVVDMLGTEAAAFLVGNSDGLHGIAAITSEEEFSAFCSSCYPQLFSPHPSAAQGGQHDAAIPDVTVLYRHIKPYLDYLRQPSWHFPTLLHYLLAIDAAIETDRIGMVNFE